MTKKTLSRIKIVIGMATIGTIGLFAKNISLPPTLYALCRAVTASVMIGGFLLFTKQMPEFQTVKKESVLFLLSGAFLGFNWSLLFEAYKHIPYAVATLCDYFAPIAVIVLCPLVYKEKLSAKQIICFVMATAGLLLLIGIGGGSGGGISFYGIMTGIAAMLCYVPVLIINKMIKSIDGLARTFLQFAGAAAVLAAVTLFGNDYDFSAMNIHGWLNLMIVGILHTGIAYCLYFSALPHLPGQEGAILSYVDPLTAVLVSLVFMNEPMTSKQMAGAVLLLVFTLGNEISFKKKGAAEKNENI